MSLTVQRDQEQELIIEKISELLKKEDWEVKSTTPYFHKNRTTVQVIIRKNYPEHNKNEDLIICDECGFEIKEGILGRNGKTIYCPNCNRENDREAEFDEDAYYVL